MFPERHTLRRNDDQIGSHTNRVAATSSINHSPPVMIKQKSRFRRAAMFAAALTACLTAAVATVIPAAAQDNQPKQGDQQKPPGDAAKQQQNKIDEMAEAARILNGPAGNAECVWTGRRIVSLLWRDDLDTASRHWQLYDRFSCPVAHIQAAFRCVVRQGDIDAKAQESLMGRVHACWINPDLPPSPLGSAQANTAPPPGTTNQ